MKSDRNEPAKRSKPIPALTEGPSPLPTTTGRNPDRDPLVTTLMLAGEAVATPLREKGTTPSVGPHAVPVETAQPFLLDDFASLVEVAGIVSAWLKKEPRLGELLGRLREAFGDGELLRLLFRLLFPSEGAANALQSRNGRILSSREIEVLREAANDISQEEIGKRLGISRLTVRQHFDNIYRKLNISGKRPIQAVARAIAMGHLDLDALEFVRGAGNASVGNFSLFSTLISTINNEELNASSLKRLAEFALILMVVSITGAQAIHSDMRALSTDARGVIMEVDRRGEIVRSFGEEFLRYPRGIVVAPPYAALQGFTPGNLFVALQSLSIEGLNSASIAEFTPAGRFVRSFCGGRDVATRMIGSQSLAFALDGRLLVSTNGMTDAILAFSEGGSYVRRFADVIPCQIAVAPFGKVYAAYSSSIGSCIKVFDAQGQLQNTLGVTAAGISYYGLAVNSRGHIFVNRFEIGSKQGSIDEWTAAGQLVRSIEVSGLYYALLAIDANDRLYVPCTRSRDIKVLSSEGIVVERIDLQGKVIPHAVTMGANDHLWVCGTIP